MPPYRRKRKFSRGRRRGRIFKSGRRSVKLIKRTVRRMQEIKWSTSKYDSGQAIPSGTYFLQEITPTFVQGVDKNQRIGNRIRYKRLTINGVMWMSEGIAPRSFCHYRCIIFAARINNPGVADVFDVVTIGGGSQGIFSTVKHQNVRVIADHIMPLAIQSNAANVQIPAVKKLRISKPIYNNVDFQSVSTILPTDPHDKIYVVFGSDAPVASASPVLTLFIKVSYYDM